MIPPQVMFERKMAIVAGLKKKTKEWPKSTTQSLNLDEGQRATSPVEMLGTLKLFVRLICA